MYTAATFVLATGERPRYLGIPGDKEYCITRSPIAALAHPPPPWLSVLSTQFSGLLPGC